LAKGSLRLRANGDTFRGEDIDKRVIELLSDKWLKSSSKETAKKGQDGTLHLHGDGH
jgi:hypothetical protein